MSSNPKEVEPIPVPSSQGSPSPGSTESPGFVSSSQGSAPQTSNTAEWNPFVSRTGQRSGESSSQNPAIPANAMIGGNRVIQLLGVGGMGQVWLAEDPRLDRPVAIKTMRREYSADPDASARFLREARAVARLNHTHVIQIFQAGEEGGILYFAMEYVRGESLAQRLKREGRLDLHQAAEIVAQVALGLAYASAYGVIHRDIKPANIMLDLNDQVKLTDFGLAKILSTDVHITQTGTAMGSPGYMSPEIAKGEPADHRSDIYSLGITFYQMLVGELPFVAPTPVSMMLKHVQEPLPEPPALLAVGNGTLMELLKKMTAKHPNNRFRDYRELIAGLKVVAETGVFGPHFHLPSTRSIPEPASPYPTPVLESLPPQMLPDSRAGREISGPTAGSNLSPHSPTTVARPAPGHSPVYSGPLATPSPERVSSYVGQTLPRTEALSAGVAGLTPTSVKSPTSPLAGVGAPEGRLVSKDALAHLVREDKQRSYLLLYGALLGTAGVIMLLIYALFSEGGMTRRPAPPVISAQPTATAAPVLPSPSPAPSPPPRNSITPVPTPEAVAAASPDPGRVQAMSNRPWPELRDRALVLLERLETEAAGVYLTDLAAVPHLPPHSPGFLYEMNLFVRDLAQFRRELLAAARQPGDAVVVQNQTYGMLTLRSVSEGHFLFSTRDNSPIQIPPSQLSQHELINMAQILISTGKPIPSLQRYRDFASRKAQINSSAPPGPNMGGPPGQGQPRGPASSGNRVPPNLGPQSGNQQRRPGAPR